MKNTIIMLALLSLTQFGIMKSQVLVESWFKCSYINTELHSYPYFKKTGNQLISIDNTISKMELVRDTITDYIDRSSGFNMYLYRDQNQIVRPVTGTNGAYHLLGSKYNIKAADLLGILVAFGTKITSGIPDSLALLISAADDSTGLPVNPILANTGFSVNDLDTNSYTPIFTPIMLKEATPLDGKFTIMLQVWTQESESDLVVVWSNKQGDARGENTAFLSVVQEQGIASFDFDEFPVLMEDSLPPNFDLMILPIIEKDVVGIENNFQFNNLSVSALFPNPIKDKAKLEIILNDENQIEIMVIDISGKFVLKQIYENVKTRLNTLELDIKQLSSGTYFCIVQTNKGSFAQKFIIEK